MDLKNWAFKLGVLFLMATSPVHIVAQDGATKELPDVPKGAGLLRMADGSFRVIMPGQKVVDVIGNEELMPVKTLTRAEFDKLLAATKPIEIHRHGGFVFRGDIPGLEPQERLQAIWEAYDSIESIDAMNRHGAAHKLDGWDSALVGKLKERQGSRLVLQTQQQSGLKQLLDEGNSAAVGNMFTKVRNELESAEWKFIEELDEYLLPEQFEQACKWARPTWPTLHVPLLAHFVGLTKEQRIELRRNDIAFQASILELSNEWDAEAERKATELVRKVTAKAILILNGEQRNKAARLMANSGFSVVATERAALLELLPTEIAAEFLGVPKAAQ